MDEDLKPTYVASLDLRGVKARLECVDGDFSMFVDDGDIEIELTSGLGGTWEQAILGAERIATVAHQFAEFLRQRRSSPPLDVPP